MKEVKYPVFQNKALDYNKLLEEQSNGKLLKKKLKFPLIAMIKYDGHYCTIKVTNDEQIFTSSGGVRYTHNIDLELPDGEYIAERIVGSGKLGDSRRGVSLQGSVGSKYAKDDNTYKIHNIINGKEYSDTLFLLSNILDSDTMPMYWVVEDEKQLDERFKSVTKDGYEGLILVNPNYVFKNTKSRCVDFCKYKKRPTADLLCIGVEEGEGKYSGVIGSLVLKDSKNRVVSVGSGMSDEDRLKDPNYFIGKVIEIEYEQIAKTYIQPTFGSNKIGVTVRLDKTEKDID